MVIKDKDNLKTLLFFAVFYGLSFTFCGFGTPILGIWVMAIGIPRFWKIRNKDYIVNKKGEPITLLVCLLTWVITSLIFLALMIVIIMCR